VESKIFSRVTVIGSRGTGLGQFNKPRSVAVDAEDNLYVVDMTGRVQKFSPDGAFLSFWEMPQTDKGKPKGMCRDEAGNILVVEPHYSRVNHFNGDGKLVAQWGIDGTNAGLLAFPRAVMVNRQGEAYVSEYGRTERVQRFAERGAKFVNGFGKPGNGPGEFNRAEGLGLDAQGRVFVADSCNHRVQVFTPDGKFLRAFGRAGSGPGEMSYPYDVRVDSLGREYVCEFGNSRVQIFDANGQPLEMLGGAGGAPGQMNNPWAITLDSLGNLYVADALNHRVLKFIARRPGEAREARVPGGMEGRQTALMTGGLDGHERAVAFSLAPLGERAGVRGWRNQRALQCLTPHPNPLPSEGRGDRAWSWLGREVSHGYFPKREEQDRVELLLLARGGRARRSTRAALCLPTGGAHGVTRPTLGARASSNPGRVA
jgi:DNA-binding beta-propeller fold protein YncE